MVIFLQVELEDVDTRKDSGDSSPLTPSFATVGCGGPGTALQSPTESFREIETCGSRRCTHDVDVPDPSVTSTVEEKCLLKEVREQSGKTRCLSESACDGDGDVAMTQVQTPFVLNKRRKTELPSLSSIPSSISNDAFADFSGKLKSHVLKLQLQNLNLEDLIQSFS